MSTPVPVVCAHCGKSHLVQKLSVSVNNSGTLTCPICRNELIRWSGDYFYTLAVSPPKSNLDMTIIES